MESEEEEEEEVYRHDLEEVLQGQSTMVGVAIVLRAWAMHSSV
jgi:hypothetical protein